MVWVGLAVAGALGASSRYLLDVFIEQRVDSMFPAGTLVINVSGSLLLGVVAGAALYHGFTGAPRLWLGTGFCGAYTTFSTFTFDTMRLFEDGETRQGLANLIGSVAASLLAAAAGLALAGL